MSLDDQREADEADTDWPSDEWAAPAFNCGVCGLRYSWDDGETCENDGCERVGRMCPGCWDEHLCGQDVPVADFTIPSRPRRRAIETMTKRAYDFDEERAPEPAAPRKPNPGGNREIRKGDRMRVSVQLLTILQEQGGVSQLVEVMDVIEQADGTKDLILTNGREKALMSDERKRG